MRAGTRTAHERARARRLRAQPARVCASVCVGVCSSSSSTPSQSLPLTCCASPCARSAPWCARPYASHTRSPALARERHAPPRGQETRTNHTSSVRPSRMQHTRACKQYRQVRKKSPPLPPPSAMLVGRNGTRGRGQAVTAPAGQHCVAGGEGECTRGPGSAVAIGGFFFALLQAM